MSTATQPPSSLVHPRRVESPSYRSKFHPPGLPRHLVRRQRLLALLDDLADYPVIALVAPAGSGKTVLAADWLAQRRRRCAWVTLEAGDRDHIDAVLARLTHPQRGAPPRTIVLDDLDRVDDDADVDAVLAAFVERLPSWLHLLILSRRRPRLPMASLRASGDLVDIGFDALRFRDEEAVALLTRLCPGLGAEELSAAVDRADGWAAALQLTALASRTHRLAADTLVEEYLWKEVLAPERPELVDLMLSAAVAGRISYGLAEALTQRPDAGDLLDEAEAAGMFLTAVDGEWFELHRLVGDVLTRRLQHRSPEALHSQHARAARWRERAGDGPAALDHWASAQRPRDELRLLADLTLPLLEAGQAARILDTLEQIPAGAASTDPDDALRYAWCQLAAGPSAFVDAVRLAQATVGAAREPARSRSAALHAVALWLQGDWHRAAAGARAAIKARTDPTDADPVDRFARHLIACGIALDERWDESAPAVCEVRAGCLKDPASRASYDGARALGLALAGRPLVALSAAESTTPAAGSVAPGTLAVPLALAHAIVEREQDHREPARAILEELSATSTYPDPVLQLVAQVELARLRMSTGDLAGAGSDLDDADGLRVGLASPTPGSATSKGSPAAAMVARAGVDLALVSEDSATAVRWSEHVADPFWGPVCEAKIWLARARQEEALHALQRALPRCPRHEVVAGLLVGRALPPPYRSTATERVGASLELAAAHGLLRTVAAEGAAVTDLIELAAWRVPEEWMGRLRRALVPTWAAQDARPPIEDLTDRERDVLRLLPSRLTLSEIASELFVSQNTLKFHLRAIYRKLGVVSRAEAVAAARRMRLLPRG